MAIAAVSAELRGDANVPSQTVTVIAGALQRSGLIEYSRGRVRILHREELESAACGCYQVCRNLQVNLYRRALRPTQIDNTV